MLTEKFEALIEQTIVDKLAAMRLEVTVKFARDEKPPQPAAVWHRDASEGWMPVAKFAKKHGISTGHAYNMARLGKYERRQVPGTGTGKWAAAGVVEVREKPNA
jgi:hypothetical protein